MKSFRVDIDDTCNSADVFEITQLLTSEGMAKYLKKHVTVKELPTIPEVKKNETGMLMSPEEITNCIKTVSIIYRNKHGDCVTLQDDNRLIGHRISTEKFPREFYRDIKTELDFDSIPKGALVEVVDDENVSYLGRTSGYGKHENRKMLKLTWASNLSLSNNIFNVGIDNIKSIRIIELTENKE